MEVAAAREFEAWNEFFGDGCSADDMAALQDSNGEASTCQISGSSKAIVAAANNQRVPLLLLQRRSRTAAKAPSPHLSAF